MRIFYAFLVIVTGAILFMLPVTEAIYDYRTDERTDTFSVTTAVGADNATVQLSTALYDSDPSTFSFVSDDTDDAPVFYSYNSTSRATVVDGLADNTTRSLDVTYDVDALSDATAIELLISRMDFIWLLMIICFPPAALAAIFLGRA